MEVIDSLVAARNLLLHPFYLRWIRGELCQEELRDYACQYYHHVAAFPTYLSAVHSRTEELSVRRLILENLVDEEGGDPTHPELWLGFAEGLGLLRQDVLGAELRRETRKMIHCFRTVCSRSTTEGLAALYAYESQIPDVARSKIMGLKTFYGIESSSALSYFSVHIDADRRHSELECGLLSSLLNEKTAPPAIEAVAQVLNALWEMLSGVCRYNGTMGAN